MSKSVQFTQSIRSWMDIFMNRSMRGWGRFAKSAGLSMPQFGLLMQMHHKGDCGMSEVSERFDITPAAASQLVDKLVQGGLVQRVEDPHDRRAKLLNLTDKGRELIQQGIQERYRWVDEVGSKLSADERGKVAEALTLLSEKAKEVDQ